MSQNNSPLFQPIVIGANTLKNRMIMSPLTRCRAVGRVPNEMMAEYYSQRATAGLIISEATIVDEMGAGYPDTPGIYNEAQVEGWKKITKAVHEKGGKIFLQLWHVGRISHSSYLNGKQPLAPSAIAAKGHVSLVRPITNYEVPKALTTEEVKEIVAQFKRGAEMAKLAEFDGVEIHGANGYLLDQFLQDGTNKRDDIYGGSIENRARFALEIVDAVVQVWGANRVGYHIAPRSDAHNMSDSNPLETFGYLMRELGKRKIAFVFSRSRQGAGSIDLELKKEFGGIYIANQGLTKEVAEQLLNEGKADAVAFGELFIMNPDLVERFKLNAPLNDSKNNAGKEGYYTPGPHGYIDYPFLTK